MSHRSTQRLADMQRQLDEQSAEIQRLRAHAERATAKAAQLKARVAAFEAETHHQRVVTGTKRQRRVSEQRARQWAPASLSCCGTQRIGRADAQRG